MTKTTLMAYTKEELVEMVLMHEKNIEVLNETIDQQYKNAVQLLERMDVFNKTYQTAKALGETK